MEDASSVDNLKEMCKENDNNIVECHKQILELQKNTCGSYRNRNQNTNMKSCYYFRFI